MTLQTWMGFAAMLGIGFFWGFSYAKKKMMVRINRLKQKIADLTPVDNSNDNQPKIN